MSDWLTPQTLVGLAAAVVFAAIAFYRPARGVLLYAVLAATPPALQIGSFSGRTIHQGLLLAEVLATILILAWIARRPSTKRFINTPFNGPLLLFAGLAVLSLGTAQALPDAIVVREATFLVSVGQVLLVLWPIGIYLATADLIDHSSQVRWLHAVLVGLAAPQFLVLLLPASVRPYMAWAVTFGLFAAPLAMAAAFYTTSIPTRLIYIVISLAPLLRGLMGGKAFLYSYVLAAAVVILWLKSRTLLLTAGGLVAAVALMAVSIGSERYLTAPLDRLVDIERSQASWGGPAGRVQLARDALSIWAEAPVVGVGPGNSYVYMLQRSPIGTPHNQYLNILAEFGILGLGAWLWFIVQTFRVGLRVHQRAREPAHAMFALGWLGMFGGLVVGSLTGDFMIHSIRNGGLELFSGYYLQWVLLGTLVGVAKLEGLLDTPQTALNTRPAFQRRPLRQPWPSPARTWARRYRGPARPRPS
jgi:O-antigen ligase